MHIERLAIWYVKRAFWLGVLVGLVYVFGAEQGPFLKG